MATAALVAEHKASVRYTTTRCVFVDVKVDRNMRKTMADKLYISVYLCVYRQTEFAMPSPFLGFIKILVAIATLHLQKNQ